MSFEIGERAFGFGQRQIEHRRRGVREKAGAAASAAFPTSKVVHMVPATANETRCCDADDRAWLAEHRVW